MRHAIKFWTGPTAVKEITQAFRDVNVRFPDTYEDIVEGTEHVYVKASGSDFDAACWNALADLYRVHGKDYGLRGKRP